MKLSLSFLLTGLLGLWLSVLPASAQRLVSVTPANGATGVPTSTTVTFTFNSDMMEEQEITWFGLTGGIFPSPLTGFTYQWTTPRTLVATKTGGFPGDTSVIWTLEEEGFSDEFGFPLESGEQNTGLFTTSAGAGGEVDGTGVAALSIYRFVNYDQLSEADPVLTTNWIYNVGANVSAPASRGLSEVILTLPGGATRQLMSTAFTPTNFFFAATTNTLAGLNGTYPAGSYAFALTAGASNQTVSLTMPATAFPAPPKISNHTAGQFIDPAGPFTLQFNAGGVASEHVQVVIYDEDAGEDVFESPEFDEPGHLNGTATSVTVPAGSFAEGRAYQVEIIRWIGQTNAVGGNEGGVSIGTVTRSLLRTIGGGNEIEIVLSNPQFANGVFSVTASLAPNRTYVLEKTTDFVPPWETAATVFAVNPTQVFNDFEATDPHAVYRVREQ